jgi:hypothetical protein
MSMEDIKNTMKVPVNRELPKIGDKSNCLACGGAIEFEGQYWRHTDSSPRHIARPKTFTRGL